MFKPPISKFIDLCTRLSLCLYGVVCFGTASAATSVGQNDVTWTFDGDYTTGQFVNGEWWVVGPVTVTAISPDDPDLNDTIDIHGSMLNPVADIQGLDSRSQGGRYQRAANVARNLPLSIAPGTTLMSVVSHSEFSSGYLSKVAVLTVLATPPPADAFRPPWYGAYKPMFRESSLNYSVLQKLNPTLNSPTPISLANGLMKHVLIDLVTGNGAVNSEFKANSLTEHYGRDISKKTNAAVLALHLNYPDEKKRDLLIEVVQRGIDAYGAVKCGFVYTPDGGQNHGRKLAMYVAAKVLGDSDMLEWCNRGLHPVFQEDCQHEFLDSRFINYSPSDWGTPEWGGDTTRRFERLAPEWESGNRFMNGQANVGVVLAVTLMSGRDEWNHEAMFQYIIHRYWPAESNTQVANRGINSTNGIPRFTYEMWNAYFSEEGSPIYTQPLPDPTQPGYVPLPPPPVPPIGYAPVAGEELAPPPVVPGQATMSTISQNDITWTFNGEYAAGQFVNGEWWVVGPVTITSISPGDPDLSDDVDVHGSMLNPGADRQGLDSRSGGDRYYRSINIARTMPYTILPGATLVSGLSHAIFDDGYLSKVAVLTVLDSPPATGSFRPPWYGSDKPMFNESALNYSVLRKLAPTPNSPTPASLTNGGMKHPLIDVVTGGGQNNSGFKANSLTEHYGREISKKTVAAALALQLNYTDAEKRDLLIEVVQRGIDTYGLVKGGYVFNPDGGHNHGRKLAMYVAAKVLGDADMMSWCDRQLHPVFQEDLQHEYVDERFTAYPSSSWGTPEWGCQTHRRFDVLNPDWESTGYRYINGQANVGLVLTVTLMGGRSEWNHEAMFEYIIDRYWPVESVTKTYGRGINSTNGIPRFTYEMWNAYFGS